VFFGGVRRFGLLSPGVSRRLRMLVASLAVSAAVATIAGCGGASSNGVAAKSPDEILVAARNAVSDAKSVHVAGSVANGSTLVTVNLGLAAGKGGSGRMSVRGLTFDVIVVKRVVYLKGSDSVWRHFGGNAAVQLLHGKWLRGPATGQLASFAALTNLHFLFGQLVSNHGALSKGGTSTVDGQKVVAVKDTTGGETLYVATTGKPYPIKIARTGGRGVGHLTFDRYNEPVSVSAPANSIDISKLR
jgi:hypothetical protein